MKLEASTNADQINELMGRMGTRIVKQARNAAEKRVIRQLSTRIKDDVSKGTGIQKKVLTPRFVVPRNRRGFMWVGTRPVSAINLAPKELKRGVSYRGPSGRIKNPSAFIAQGRSGNAHVFQRRGAARLPLDKQEVEFHDLAKRSANRLLRTFAPAKYEERFAHEFNRRLGREIEKTQGVSLTRR